MAGDDENTPEASAAAAPTGPEIAEALGAMAMVGTVKLPDFWPDSTALWFARADAQFRLKKVTAEQTKFDHVITMLDSKTAAQVMDVLITPPGTCKPRGHPQDGGDHPVWTFRIPPDALWTQKCSADFPTAYGLSPPGSRLSFCLPR